MGQGNREAQASEVRNQVWAEAIYGRGMIPLPLLISKCLMKVKLLFYLIWETYGSGKTRLASA